MAEMQVLSARPHVRVMRVGRVRARRNLLEEQVELWWFREPRKSMACYCVCVALVVACGAGGVGVLSSTTSSSGAWRLVVGVGLCLLALAVLLKQLLSSAVQDMGCVRSWGRIRALKSGGPSDHALVLLTGGALLVCGAALLGLAPPHPGPGSPLSDMALTGVVLLAGGGATVLGAAGYSAATYLLERTGGGSRLTDRPAAIFTISGRMGETGREATSSMVNLL
ncbi:transmembrane protein 125-like [Conger conger]|uniref:transmembrane protein 125-like n=1 Tax=Conger conger TaxID=82655 RepID=UPI002A5A2990|nr:transmembrane protein 125-like [Conger conger]